MVDSILRNRKGILLMLLSSVCVCVGQLLWKLSATHGVPFLFVGFAFYGVGALMMIIAYRYGKLSILQPLLSMNYVLSILLGYFVLGEQVSLIKCFGVLVIISGVVLIAGGDKP